MLCFFARSCGQQKHTARAMLPAWRRMMPVGRMHAAHTLHACHQLWNTPMYMPTA